VAQDQDFPIEERVVLAPRSDGFVHSVRDETLHPDAV